MTASAPLLLGGPSGNGDLQVTEEVRLIERRRSRAATIPGCDVRFQAPAQQ